MLGGQGVYIGILQNIKAFGIGLPQAILDAVMNHLDEVPGADRTGMNVVLLAPALASLAPAGALGIADPGGQAREDRVEAIDRCLIAADHHAIAAIDPPHAA